MATPLPVLLRDGCSGAAFKLVLTHPAVFAFASALGVKRTNSFARAVSGALGSTHYSN